MGSVDKPRGDGGGDGGECRRVWPCAPCVPNPATAATVSVVTDQSEVAWVASRRAAVWLWGVLAHTLYLHVAQLHLSLEFLLLPCVCCCVPDLVGLRVQLESRARLRLFRCLLLMSDVLLGSPFPCSLGC